MTIGEARTLSCKEAGSNPRTFSRVSYCGARPVRTEMGVRTPMASRMTGQARRWTAVGAAAALLGSLFFWGATPSYAVHDTGMFELDGNTAQNATPPPYDWEGLFNADGTHKITPSFTSPLLASGFFADAAKPDHSYFAQSDKDIHDITTWKCKTVKTPTPKDDLLNAYAAVVQVPAGAPDNAGHKVLYLGSERRSNNGDSFAGFWLLKDPTVGCTTTGATTPFTGHHTVGDIFVASNYTNGGGSQDVQVYAWQAAKPHLKLLTAGAVCNPAVTGDDACAIANTDTITPPWDTQTLKKNEFVEAGVDLTALLGNAGVTSCFSTVLAETRSSQQTTAELKDFTAGTFNTCPPPPITTTATPGGPLVTPGTPEHDVATVRAVDDLPTPTGTVSFFLCTPDEVTAGGCEDSAGTQVGSPVTLDNGSATSATIDGTTTPNDLATGKYCWRAEYTPDEESAGIYVPSSETNADVGGPGAECFVVIKNTTTITTQASPTTGTVGVAITVGDTASFAPTNLVVPPTGSVTFTLYSDDTCSTAVPGVSGTGDITTSGGVSSASFQTSWTPTAPGTYKWIAAYPGDADNTAFTTGCGDDNEQITITAPPTTPTSPTSPPPPTSPPTPTSPPLANTGFPTGTYLGSAVGLLLAGALILGFSVRRRRGRHEA